jgi:hypothetical protein
MPLQNKPNKAKSSFHMSRIVLAMADLPRHSTAIASAFRHSRSVVIENLRFKIKNSYRVTQSNAKYREVTFNHSVLPGTRVPGHAMAHFFIGAGFPFR